MLETGTSDASPRLKASWDATKDRPGLRGMISLTALRFAAAIDLPTVKTVHLQYADLINDAGATSAALSRQAK